MVDLARASDQPQFNELSALCHLTVNQYNEAASVQLIPVANWFSVSCLSCNTINPFVERKSFR